MAVEIRCHEGVVEIEPAPSPVVLERRGRFLVATPVHPAATLTREMVERTRRCVRRSETGEPEAGEP